MTSPPRALVLGDGGSGKSSLLRAAGLSQTNGDGLLLECSSIEAPASDVGELSGLRPHADVWELAGGAWVGGVDHSKLARSALARARSSCALVLIVLDLSEPRSLVDRARYWLSLVESRLAEACADAEDGGAPSDPALLLERLRERVAADWAWHRSRWLEHSDGVSEAGAVPSPNKPQSSSQLPDGVLSRNPGVRLLLVGTKWDELLRLRLPTPLVEHVQYQMRSLCVSCGAEVVYTAVPPSGAPCQANRSLELESLRAKHALRASYHSNTRCSGGGRALWRRQSAVAVAQRCSSCPGPLRARHVPLLTPSHVPLVTPSRLPPSPPGEPCR